MPFVPASFIVALTSGMVFPVTLATTAKSGVPGAFPFGLFEAEDGGRRAVSATDCTEFCLALAEAGLPPLTGAGDARTGGFISGNVLRTGEDANEGDIAAFAVLFLFLACPLGAALALADFLVPSGAGVDLGLPALPFEAVPLVPKTPFRTRSVDGPAVVVLSTFRLFGGFPFVPFPLIIPSPTPVGVSVVAAFRALLFP